MTTKAFLSAGGDNHWIKNIKTAPEKLRKLIHIAEIIWKHPWKLSQKTVKVYQKKLVFNFNFDYFQSLTVGENSWTLAQLVHAVGE